MERQDVFALIDRFERSGLRRLKLTEKDFSLELEQEAAAPAAVKTAPAAPPVETAAPEGETINAPLVGTYYAAPSADAEPFVRVGDRVAKGQTICLIEAMKTMSEIPAPCDLIVEALFTQNGALVEFGAPILRYRHV